MKKQDLFLAAMLAEEFRRTAWVISAFSLINEGPEAWQANPYAYRIVQTPAGHFFIDPANSNQLSKVEDAKAGEPLFSIKERASYTPAQTGGLVNAATEASYGQWLANWTVNFWPFGKKLGFIKGRISPGQMEDLIVKRLKDTPEDASQRNEQDIYVDEYLKFCDAMFFLAGFSQLCVPAATEKSMVPPPGMAELKKRLLEENKERLHDPAVVAKIEQQLMDFDREWLKGDPSEGFLQGKKSYQVRKKMFGMYGAESGFSDEMDVQVIGNSLAEGWDIRHMKLMMDSLRKASYNRGAQTMLGGESVKWLLRASSNITVTKDDCGTRLGNEFTATPENYQWLTGFHVIQPQGSKQVVSDEDAKSYIGKKLLVRSPMFCNMSKTDYCKACVGERLATNPTGLSSVVAEQGSAFLDIYLKAAHGQQLSLAKMEIKTAIT